MKSVLNTLKKKKLQFLFLFYILLILPLLSPMAQNLSQNDVFLIIFVNGLIFSFISILSVYFTGKFEKVAYCVLLVFSLIPTAIFMSYLLFAQVLLQENSVISLFETNPEESKEFIGNYLNPWIVAGVLLYVFIPVIMIWKMKKTPQIKIKNNFLPFFASVICLIVIFSVGKLSSSIYTFNFYKTFALYKVRLANEEKGILKRQTIDYPVSLTAGDSIPQTLIVVIGESLTRHHMSLYGYERNTNPLLSGVENLHVYKDIVSPQVHTIPVIRSVFSLSEKSHPEYFTEKPSLFEVFNRAGFETFFISNQPFGGKSKTSYDVVLNLAQNKYSLSQEKKNDEVVLGKLHEILGRNDKKNKLIVIHLIGNHMAYEFRYPKNFEVFDNLKDGLVADAKYRNAAAKKMIDRYDNSVLYNDSIVYEVIQQIKDQPKAGMLYFSDHGEELYDLRDFAGHAYEKFSHFMCEIPFMLWISNPEKYPELEFDTQRPYSTVDVMQSISDIAGLRYKDFDATKSIFSSSFKPKERFVGEYSYEKETR